MKENIAYFIILWKRQAKTETHQQLWTEFEHMLRYRSNFAMMIQVINGSQLIGTAKYAYHKSASFCADETSSCNSERVEVLSPYIKWFLLGALVARFLMVITSYWRPGIVKYYFLVATVTQMAYEALPIDNGDVHLSINQYTMVLFLVNYSFDFWSAFALVILQNYYLVAIRFCLYNGYDLATLIRQHTTACIIISGSCASIHIMISWIGLKFIEAELPRESNERLLNNFKEGVIILNEQKSEILFTNFAARQINQQVKKMYDRQTFVPFTTNSSNLADDCLHY